MRHQSTKGFTLAELLIALLILGQIATFTIPKVLSAQANGRNKAIAKEIIAMTASAHSMAQLNGVLTTSSTYGSLTQYMNYVAVDTSTTIDGLPTGADATFGCNDVLYRCLKLHNGAVLIYIPNAVFSTTSGFVPAIIDPDGQLTGKRDSLGVILYYNGRTVTYTEYLNNTAYTPSWFSW